MIKNFAELIERTQKGGTKKIVAVAAAHDEHTLEAVDRARKNNIAEPILIGDVEKIREIIESNGFQLKDAIILKEKADADAAKKAVALVRGGEADFLMKGNLQTNTLLREVVNREQGLHTGSVMSHFGLFELPSYHKLLALTDGGMMPNPDANEKAQILINAIAVLRTLGYDSPKAAALAAAEQVNVKIQASVDAEYLKKANQKGRITNCVVEGPISFDLAISPESAKIKGYESPVTGDTDILLVPDMTCGNILAKSFQFMAGAKMAGIIVGAKVPVILVSRGAASDEKYFSMVLAAAASQKQKQEK
jgi:phosphate butyryltransferase